MVDSKRIVNNSIVLTLRMFVTMGISIYASRIILQALGAVDYGIYNVIGGVISMFSFLNTSMIASTQRFLNYSLGEKDYEKTRKTFVTSLNLHYILAIILFFIAETFGVYFVNHLLNIPEDRLFTANIVFQITIVTAIFNVVSIPYKALIVAYERMNIYAYEAIFQSIATLLISYLILYFGGDKLMLYSILLMLVGIVVRIFDRWYCVNKLFYHYTFFLDKEISAKILSFSGWSMLVTAAHFAYTQGSIILINVFFGPAINAAQALANQINLSLMTFSSNFVMAVKPQIVKSYASHDMKYMEQLIINSLKVSCLIMGVVVSPFLVKGNYILNLWLTDVPSLTQDFLQLALVLSILVSFSEPITTAIQATGKIRKYQIVESIFLVTILPFTYLLYKFGFQAYSTYWVRMIIFAILLAVRIIFLVPILNLSFKRLFIEIIVKTILCIIAAFIVLHFFSLYIVDNLIGFISVCFLSLSLNCVIGFFFLFNEKEKMYMKNFVRSKFIGNNK